MVEGKPFAAFVGTLDANQGGYIDLAATSGNSSLQVFGQKNLNKNEAYAWIRNKNHTWKNVEANNSIPAITDTVTIKMNAAQNYTLTWFNTYSGATISTQTVKADGNGNLTLQVNSLTDDVAIKIN